MMSTTLATVDIVASFASFNFPQDQEFDERLEVAELDDELISSGMVSLISHRREGTSC